MELDSFNLEQAIESILANGILSKDQITQLSFLSAARQRILDHLSLTWQLKSRTKWALQGDSNTNFFHMVASGRRTQNMIWSLEDEAGNIIDEDGSLKELGKCFFQNIFTNEGLTCLDQQLNVISLFPRMIPLDHSNCLTTQVTLKEIEHSLKSFKKDRSPGPDGWPVEFYLHFFDLLGPILCQLVDSTRISGFIPSSLNSTFLTLIPKKDKPRTFADFRPISLCNLLYKLIAKVIAGRLKPFLDQGISYEQFGFLKDRQIYEPIGIVQEVLHSIKTKNICAFILKLDLTKDFDRVDWTFVRFILIQIGVPLLTVNWIMGCITTGTSSNFFTASRGIRQGFPLSPLIFILVIEGLSLLIKDARSNGLIRGIKLSSSLTLSHLLFVDDAILLSYVISSLMDDVGL